MRDYRSLITCLLICLSTAVVLGQDPGTTVARYINFDGYSKNNIDFLRTNVNIADGDVIDMNTIEEGLQRLKNTTGIGNASYTLDSLSDGVGLTYTVEEIKTLLPIFNFGGIRNNVWFQVGFVDINWRGRGEVLSAYYQNNDQRHSGEVFYRKPRIHNSPWGYSASLTKWSSREPLFFPGQTVLYDYDNNSVAASIIRNFGLNRLIEIGGSYFVETYNKSDGQVSENPDIPLSLRQPKFLTKLEYQTNKLNYHFFYLKGGAWRLTYQNVFNTLDNTWFNSLQFQGMYFKHIGQKKRTNLAFRVRLGISTNNDSPFAPFVADSHVNLRGVGNRIDRGTAQVVINAEYRRTIFFKEQTSRKWAVQVVGFVDMGSWRDPGGEITDLFNPDQFREFVGGGIRIINNKIFGAVLRIDYGVDVFDPNQRGIVLGLGQYF